MYVNQHICHEKLGAQFIFDPEEIATPMTSS